MIATEDYNGWTERKVFAHVARHLLDMPKPSVVIVGKDGKTVCRYRGDDGLACAAGCLIPDSEYDELYMEEQPASLVFYFDSRPHKELIVELQELHDDYIYQGGDPADTKAWKKEVLQGLRMMALERYETYMEEILAEEGY